MGRFKVWLNRQIARVLGDLEEREPVEDPSPARAICRIFFMASLLLGFSSLLVYNFIDAPDARVVQIHRLTLGDENHAFPSCFLYDRNSTACKKWSKAEFPEGIPVSCPCTNLSVRPWKSFVKFYMLRGNLTNWKMSRFAAESLPLISVVLLRNKNIVKDDWPINTQDFCAYSHLWPIANQAPTSPGTLPSEVDVWMFEHFTEQFHVGCLRMASLFFDGYESRMFDRGTRFVNTQTLLDRKELNTFLAQLARESVLTTRLSLDMAMSVALGNEDLRRYYNALTQLLIGLLDRDEMSSSQSYVYGVQVLLKNWSLNQFFDNRSTVLYLRDRNEPIFLQAKIDWKDYREHCSPKYCEVIKPLRGARKLYWAFGMLGGVATIVLAVVTTLLWPCTAMLLLWISKRKTAAMVMFLRWISKRKITERGNSERSKGPLLPLLQDRSL